MEEVGHPSDAHGRERHVEQEDFQAEPCDDGEQYDARDEREGRFERGLRHESLQSGVVTDALVVVADALRLEEGHGQPQQLGQIVAQDVDVDARAHVKAHPARHEVHAEGTEKEGQLCQHEVDDDAHVLEHDAVVHQVLRDEGRHEREADAGEHREGERGHLPFVGPDVLAGKLHEAVFLLYGLSGKELLGGFYGHHDALLAVEPAVVHLLLAVGMFAIGGIGDAEGSLSVQPVAFYLVEHHEVVLVPVQDGRFGASPFELVERHLKGSALHADLSEGVANARHAHPFSGEVGKRSEVAQGIFLPVGRGHHADAGRPAVHLVKLSGELQ